MIQNVERLLNIIKEYQMHLFYLNELTQNYTRITQKPSHFCKEYLHLSFHISRAFGLDTILILK